MMICKQFDNKFDQFGCHMVWYIQYYSDVQLNWLEQNRETTEEHDDDCVEEGFQLARVKLDKDGEEGREALGMRNRSINI